MHEASEGNYIECNHHHIESTQTGSRITQASHNKGQANERIEADTTDDGSRGAEIKFIASKSADTDAEN